jgi:hypothetical protein
MSANKKNRFLTYLAGATISVSSGTAGAVQTDLTGIPEDFLGGIGDGTESDASTIDEKTTGLSFLFDDKRPGVRNRVSELLAVGESAIPWDTFELILARLAEDAVPEIRDIATRTLTAALRDSGGITRTRVASEWALSDSPAKRVTIAQALSSDFYCLGADIVADHLSADPDPEVRAAVVQIAAARMHENPEHYGNLLEILTSDPVLWVRSAARSVVGALSETPQV